MIVDELIEKGKVNIYKDNQEEVKQERFKAILETTIFQLENCNLYRQLSKKKGFNPRRDLKSIDDIHKIPYLTTANFKGKSGKPRELICVPENEIYVWCTSSGTSGDPSVIGRDYLNVQRFFKGFDFLLEEMTHLVDYKWTLFFTPPPQKIITREDKITEPIRHMMYAFEANNKLPMDERVYGLKLADEESRKQGKMFEFDADGTFGFLNSNPNEKGMGWLGGSIPLLHMSIVGYSKKTGQSFNVGEDTGLLSGGGWKTYSGEAVDPKTFRKDLSEVLGMREERIFDAYSFTETDCLFCECEYHNKHLLPWQDVVVRDVESLEPVEMGEKGLINVINPCAHGFAGVSILQDDIVQITMEDDCPCGRKGKILEIIGRAEGAEAKGCGAQLSEDTT
ncbi:MAG: hypothetical protein ACFFAS_13285 [Promethearchaeota archaeon]